jgi:hypothetical protein
MASAPVTLRLLACLATVSRLAGVGASGRASSVSWWCAQPDAGRADALICQKHTFKERLRSLSSAAERAALIDAQSRPTAEQHRRLMAEEAKVLAAYCALDAHRYDSYCLGSARHGARERDHGERERDHFERARDHFERAHDHGGSARDRFERMHDHGERARDHGARARDHGAAAHALGGFQRGRPNDEYDECVSWYCASGGHPAAAEHAAKSMICAAWRHRSSMRDVRAAGGDPAAITDAYRRIKERHRDSHEDVRTHVSEQREMISAYCADKLRAAGKLCTKWKQQHAKSELR